MKRTMLTAALASAALIIAGPALGQGRGGGHGGGHGGSVGVGAGGGHGGKASARVRTDQRVDVRTDGRTRREQARARSRGPAHASARALARANENSVLARAVAGTPLVGLRTGMVVRDGNGVAIGTVRKVLLSSGGRVSNVLVASADGRRTIPLAPATLTVSGDTVTTTRVTNRRR